MFHPHLSPLPSRERNERVVWSILSRLDKVTINLLLLKKGEAGYFLCKM
jgi:hypothetical protein